MCKTFNNLLIELKDLCIGKRRQDFWDLIVESKNIYILIYLLFITNTE